VGDYQRAGREVVDAASSECGRVIRDGGVGECHGADVVDATTSIPDLVVGYVAASDGHDSGVGDAATRAWRGASDTVTRSRILRDGDVRERQIAGASDATAKGGDQPTRRSASRNGQVRQRGRHALID